jgi:hypothetical protein
MQKLTTQSFIAKAKQTHGDKYNYSKSVYTFSRDKVTINCPIHGDWNQTAAAHLRGKGCGKCGAIYTASLKKNLAGQTFKDKAKRIHGDLYDYSKTFYVASLLEVEIFCNRHEGIFLQKPKVHLKGHGCPVCGGGNSKRITPEEFISKSKQIHSNFYDYSQTNYIGSKYKVAIGCPVHGQWMQLATSHLQGIGCPTCGHEVTKKANSENPMSWGISGWRESAKISKKFDGFKVYILFLSSDEESFYKIGRTYTETAFRARNIPYTCRIVHEIKHEEAEVIFNLEKELKRKYRLFRYQPKIFFGGWQECFSELDISDIIAAYPTNYTPKIDDAPTPTP